MLLKLSLFIILQPDTDRVKVERDVSDVGEEDSIDMKTDDVYRPSAFFVRKAEYEVSLVMVIVAFHYFVNVPKKKKECA